MLQKQRLGLNKRVLKGFLFLAMILLVSSFASAQTYFSDDLEDNDLSNPTWSNTAGVTVDGGSKFSSTYSMKVNHNNWDTVYSSINNSGTTGMYNLTFTSQYEDNSDRFVAGVTDLGLDYQGCSVLIGDVRNDGSFLGVGSYNGAYTDIAVFPSGVSHEFKLVLNASDKTFDFYLDGNLSASDVGCDPDVDDISYVHLTNDNSGNAVYFDDFLVVNATPPPPYVPPTEVSLPVWNSVEQYSWNDTHIWLNYSAFIFNDGTTDFNGTNLTIPSRFSNNSIIHVDLISDTIFTQSFTNITIRNADNDISVNFSAASINYTDDDWNITGTGQNIRSMIPKQVTTSGLISCITTIGDGCGVSIANNCASIMI